MADEKLTDQDLETLFSAAADTRVDPDAAWLDRVSADAARLQSRPAPMRVSLWRQLSQALGGGATWGGLALAGAAGIWIGFAPPALLGDPVARALSASETGGLMPGAAFDIAAVLEEG